MFAFAFVAGALIVALSEISYSRSIVKLDQLETYAVARTNLRDVQLDLLEAESGQRGYLLTGQLSYLRPYQDAIEKIDASLKRLDRYYSDEASSQKLLQRLHEHAQIKLVETARTIALHDKGEREAAIELVQRNAGQDSMDVIREVTAQLLSSETQRIGRVRSDLYNSLLLSRLGWAALSLVSLSALFLFLRQNFALKQKQLELQQVLQTESSRLALLVTASTAELIDLNQHLQTAREDERHRLARNLHDELGALLTAAKLDVARIKRRLLNQPTETTERLSHLDSVLNSSIALGRGIIEDLRPSTLSNLGLTATLQILLRDFSERSGVKVISTLEVVELTHAAELVVYRMVQEGITNISKYAAAKTVWVSMSAVGGTAHISVRDDGVGFDTKAGAKSAYGLVGMHYRVAAARGQLTVASEPGVGTTLSLNLPETKKGG